MAVRLTCLANIYTKGCAGSGAMKLDSASTDLYSDTDREKIQKASNPMHMLPGPIKSLTLMTLIAGEQLLREAELYPERRERIYKHIESAHRAIDRLSPYAKRSR